MDNLTDGLKKMRARAVVVDIHPIAPEEPVVDDSLSAMRATFTAFPLALQQAMRMAASRNGWTSEQWAYQVELLAENIADGWTTPEQIVAGYNNPVPGDGWGAPL